MPPHILLLGAHGKVALQLLPLLLARSWSVTALIRDPDQTPDILDTRSKIPTAAQNPGTLSILVDDIEAVKTPEDASRIFAKAQCDWVVWSAGAGGKGGSQRTNAIDRDASIAFARAAASTPSISKYLLISAVSIRRRAAPWWTAEQAAAVKKSADAIAAYTAAKLAADEVLTVVGEERRARIGGFNYVILRPGMLTDEAAKGKVRFGRTNGGGSVPRGDVAAVAAEVLGVEGANGWYDLVAGEGTVKAEVERVVREKEDAMKGEKVEEMRETLENVIGREKEAS